jgi:hypothetical protein
MKRSVMMGLEHCDGIHMSLILTLMLMVAGCSMGDGEGALSMTLAGGDSDSQVVSPNHDAAIPNVDEPSELDPEDAGGANGSDVSVGSEDAAILPTDEDETLCLVECDDRECGSNGCGGSCGECGDGLSCSVDGSCEAPAPDCTPQCFRNTCGGDGCGGTCGQCGDGASCVTYQRHSSTSSFKLCEADAYDQNESSLACPPELSEMGNEIGDIVPEVALLECGTDFPINHLGMCSNTLSIAYQINVDCGPCIGYVNSVLGPLQEEFGSRGVQFYVVYDEPDECDTGRYFRDGAEEIKYVFAPLRFAYAYLFGTGGRASTLILSSGNQIEYYGKGDGTDPNGPSSDMLREYIEAAINP